MAEADEEEDVQSLKLKHSLLIGLKTTVEGLLATHSNNVWSTYGGLSRICKDLERILNHRLKFVRDETGSIADFWTFAKGLKWLNPVMSPFIERIRKGAHQGESKGQVWVRESLLNHNLTAQLKILVNNKQHLHSFYFEDAFLFSEEYFEAMCVCLQAVEENKASLLAEINPKLLNFSTVLSSSYSLQRTTSLPITSQRQPPRTHRNSHGDTMALAPPFASPTKESVLTLSGDHTPVCNIASSPDDSRTSAKEALRDVLRKSGSESPPEPGKYSLYDPMNSDPLCNVDFLSEVNMRAKEPSPVENKTKTRKSTITRTVSESGIDEKQAKRHAVRLDKAIIEDDIFTAKPEKVNSSNEKQDTKEPSRVIFSDSESADVKSASSPKKNAKSKGPAHTHKRSRSDISGIKQTLTPVNIEDQNSDGTPPNTVSAAPFLPDEVDGRRDSFFPQPVQGQSLLHYLSSQDFHTCATLDKENAHFSISEALIAAIEQMKWNHLISPDKQSWEQEEGDSDEEIKELRQRIRIRKRERLKERARGFPAFSDGRTDTNTTTSHSQSACPFSSPHHSEYSDSADSSEVDDQEIDINVDGEANLSKNTLRSSKSSGLSQSQASLASLFTDADVEKNVQYDRQNSLQGSSSAFFSAESVAISLLKKFSEKQLPKASDLQWLVTEQDAPQRLLPLPNSYPISPDDAENMQISKNRTRLRGNMEWAPPRPQIIFNIHPPQRRNSLLGKQNYRCTGCGMKVEIGYAKRYRYCEYLGKYFCQCCHSNKLAYIPGRILQKWDFTKYYVSNFAFDLLTKMYIDPLFNLADINPMLYKKVRLLDHIKDWRQQLWHLKSLLQVCKHANKLLSEIMKQPSHWIDDIHTYSISDLVSVKENESNTKVKSGTSGLMYSIMRSLVTESLAHVENCKFCHCFGFICEMCRNQNDIIFPYELQKVTICQGCKTCFHKKCFVPHKCPKCARIEVRNQRLKEDSVENDDDDKNDDS